MKSGINPFDSQEAKPYKNDPEILAMTNLVVSYQNNDINEFESILRNNRNNIMADPFIKEHIEGEKISTTTWLFYVTFCTPICFSSRFIAQHPNASPDQIDSSVHAYRNTFHFDWAEYWAGRSGKPVGVMHSG